MGMTAAGNALEQRPLIEGLASRYEALIRLVDRIPTKRIYSGSLQTNCIR
jgi:hypothetical protein